MKSYQALDSSEKNLTKPEENVLKIASKIYNDNKGFEYFDPEDALTAYRRYPDLGQLDSIATKLIGVDNSW